MLDDVPVANKYAISLVEVADNFYNDLIVILSARRFEAGIMQFVEQYHSKIFVVMI